MEYYNDYQNDSDALEKRDMGWRAKRCQLKNAENECSILGSSCMA
jgi:hypothetical protein